MDLDFLKEIGEAIKGTDIDSVEDFEKALVDKVKRLRLSVSDLDIQYDKGVATVMGVASDQATKEKVLLAVGNTKGVSRVKDSLVVGLTASQKAELRRSTTTRMGSKLAAAKAAADKAAEKARKEAKAKFDLESRRAAFKKELDARRQKGASIGVTYTVKKGDSLRKIAKKLYGNESKWKAIYEANQPMIKNPDLIYPGQVLRIPKA
jgi:nucleoid-associated protein YgaU